MTDVDELLKEFSRRFTKQYDPNDWVRLKGVRIQEPLEFLELEIEHTTVQKQIETLESFREHCKNAFEPSSRGYALTVPELDHRIAELTHTTKEGENE